MATKRLYQLRQGDTLRTVAREQLGDEERWQELAYINSIEPPYFVAPGTVIMVPTDDAPIDIIVTKGIQPDEQKGPPRSLAVSPSEFSPAQAVAIAAGVLFMLWVLGAR